MNNLEGKKLSCFEELLKEWFDYGIEPILKNIDYKFEMTKNNNKWITELNIGLRQFQKLQVTKQWIYSVYTLTEKHKSLDFNSNLIIIYNIFEEFFYKWLDYYFNAVEEDFPEDMQIQFDINGMHIEYPVKYLLEKINLTFQDLPKINYYKFIGDKNDLTFMNYLQWIDDNYPNLVTVLHNIVSMNNDNTLIRKDYLQDYILPYRFKSSDINKMISQFSKYYSCITKKEDDLTVKLIFDSDGNKAIIGKLIEERKN